MADLIHTIGRNIPKVASLCAAVQIVAMSDHNRHVLPICMYTHAEVSEILNGTACTKRKTLLPFKTHVPPNILLRKTNYSPVVLLVLSRWPHAAPHLALRLRSPP